jgi:uncharacterized repeat protein (TIGR01451 family)
LTILSWQRWARGALLVASLVGAAPNYAAHSITLATSNATPVHGGAAFSYTVTLNGDAVLPINTLVLTLPLRDGTLFQNVSISGLDAGFVNCVAPATNSAATLVCRANDFPASGVAVVTVVAKFAPEFSGGVTTITARAVGDGFAATASVQQTRQNDASLSVSSLTAPAATAGDIVDYVLSVLNNGHSSAINAVLTDTLPTTLEFVRVFGDGDFAGTCTYNPALRTVRCRAPRINSGTHRVTIVAEALGNQPDGNVSHNATLTAGAGAITGPTASGTTGITHSRLDVDKNAAYAAATDAMMVLRHLFGYKGAAVVANAIGANAKRDTAPLVAEYLDYLHPQLDIDGDGSVNALTDGLLIVRYLLNLRGTALISQAVAPGATRSSIIAIETYLAGLTPP